MTPARAAAFVALVTAACGRTGLEVETPVLVRADPTSSAAGGAGATGGAPPVGGSHAGGVAGGAHGGGAGHGGSIVVGGSGGNPIATCDPDQSPCIVAADCCSKLCHNEDIPVCGPPPCTPVGMACLLTTDCCSKICADGICAKPSCAPGSSACSSCVSGACCGEVGACQTSPPCAQGLSCAEGCVEQGNPISSCWETCVAPSLVSNALFACVMTHCAAACF